MPTEEQTSITGQWSTISAGGSYGQKLTIPNRTITKVSFPLAKLLSPVGTLWFDIWRASDGVLIVQKLWGYCADVPPGMTWLEVTLTAPTTINEEVYMMARASDTGVGGLKVYYLNTDSKPGECKAVRTAGGVFTDRLDHEACYIYTYEADAPSVTTDPATEVT